MFNKREAELSQIYFETIATTLDWNTSQPRPTGGHLQEFHKAIHSICSITDFYLITQYSSYMKKRVNYL